jgi:hypothetical protein
MANLSLDLFLEKSDFVHTESIRFVATLTNRGSQPETLLSLDRLANSLSVILTDAAGVARGGKAMNQNAAEGLPAPHVTTAPTIVLAPGQKAQETGDVLVWLGELLPGTYTIQGAYEHDREARAESAAVTITVAPASPTLAVPSLPSTTFSTAPRVSTWLNRQASGWSVFLLTTSANVPSVALSNRPIATLAAEAPVYPSSANSNPPAAMHLVWFEGGTLLRVVRLPAEKAPEPSIDIPLPAPGLRLLGRPFSDVNGDLFAVFADAEGFRGTLVKQPAGAAPSATPINPSPPMSGATAVHWTRDEQLVLLWTGDDRKEIHGAITPIAKPANPLTGRRLFTAPHPVANLLPYLHYDEMRETYTPKCVVLCHNQVLDMFLSLRINLATGALESKEEFLADGMGELTVYQAELNGLNQAAYLMVDPDDAIYYAPPDLGKTKPILLIEAQPYLNTPAVPLTVDHAPMLFAAGRLSDHPGFHLRYIDEGIPFTTKKLG